ncbi:MAG: cytochrome c [Devosia sp.]
MPLSRLALLPLLGLVAVATYALAQDLPPVDPAIAGMTADQKVEARQAAMKEDGRLLGQLGKGQGDPIEVATAVLQNMTNFPALFADGATSDKSHALPAVWEQFDDFTAIFKKGQEAAAGMLTAASAGDSAGVTASIKTLGGLCFECHQTYRGH